MLLDPTIRGLLGRLSVTWGLSESTQIFLREVTPNLLSALSSSD